MAQKEALRLFDLDPSHALNIESVGIARKVFWAFNRGDRQVH